MEVLLTVLLGVPFVFFLAMVWCMTTSKGECYFCGHRFEDYDIVHKTEGKKTCEDCWAEGRYDGDKR